MRILFVYPSINNLKTYTHSVSALSAILKEAGHITKLYQPDKIDKSTTITEVRTYKPDVICFSSTTNQWEPTKIISGFIKEEFETPLFAGGIHTTLFPDSIHESTYIDGICRGEGEHALLELVEKIENGEDFLNVPNFWFRNGDKIIKNDVRPLIKDLDILPYPDREIFQGSDIYNYPGFVFSRGCPFNCSYCCNQKLRELYKNNGRFTRYRSAKKAVEEIEQTVDRYKLRYVLIDDDTFTKNKKWLSEFCLLYKKKIDLPFYCNARVETIDKDTCKLLKESGCGQLLMGVESGDIHIRRNILNRHMSDEQIIEAFKNARESGLKTYSFNMVGIPEENPQKFEKTIELNQKIKPDEMQITIFYPYPGTALGDICSERGYVKKKFHYNYTTDTILDLPDFPPEEIVKSATLFKFNVYKKYSYRKAIIGLIASNTVKNTKLVHYLKPFYNKLRPFFKKYM